MLYAVAVRSSLVLRLGVVEEIAIAHDLEAEFNKIDNPFTQLEKPSEQLEPIKQSSGILKIYSCLSLILGNW